LFANCPGLQPAILQKARALEQLATYTSLERLIGGGSEVQGCADGFAEVML
jgi:hypothetical protein